MSQPGTPSLLRAMNDRAALDLLVSEGPLTRSEIGERTGLSKVTASQLLARLNERGLVEVVGSRTGSRGPNAELYGVVGSAGYGAGVDVGPAGITVAVADITGRVRGEATVSGGSDDLTADVHGALRAALRKGRVAQRALRSVVIGTPGVVDPRTGEVDIAIDIPAWHPGLPQGLGRRLRCPVTVENDVNLAALAEQAHGHATDAPDFVLLWVGRGLGLGVVLGGRLHRGASGGAGEVGYLPVPGAPLPTRVTQPQRASLQSLVSAEAVVALAAEAGLPHDNAQVAVEAAVAAGHPVLDVLSERMAVGLAAICVVLDPSLVVLSGDVGRAGGAALADRVARAVPRIAPVHPTVVVTGVAGNPVLDGALLLATEAARNAVFDGA